MKEKGFFKLRNSIALHNLRLSKRDLVELELEKKASTVHNSVSLQLHFQAEKELVAQKKHLTQVLDPNIDESPQLGPPEKRDERA